MPLEERKARLARLTQKQVDELLWDWAFWARPEQLLPPGDWITWLILAGRGFGKTRTGAETVRQWVREGSTLVNLIGATADDARDIMIEGESGILAICTKDERPIYVPSKRRLEWPKTGATSLIFTADEPERLRGKQHEKLWADELAAWRYPEAWDQASLGLRLGLHPQALVTTTPKPTKLIKTLVADPTAHVTRGSTYDNRGNLAEAFMKQIVTRYEGTRLGRQELNAEILDDNPNALWKRSDIDAGRIHVYPQLTRIVVPIDPAVTAKEDSDETGIIPCGMDSQDPPHFYVLDDVSGIYTPDQWAQAAVNAYHRLEADRIVGETNNGGDMIEAMIRNKDTNAAFTAVHASRGKAIRAEPISALYEQGRVHHVGSFPILEDQLCEWDPITSDGSPDRLDSLVWGLTELSGGSDGWAAFITGELRDKEKR